MNVAPTPVAQAAASEPQDRDGRAHWPWCLALLLLILPGYGHLLVGDEGVISRDFGLIYLDTVTQQHAALRDGHVLLWDPSQLGGTPFWSLPNQAPFYPPLMACLLLRGAIGGLNLCLFLHVLWGALGTYALVFLLGRRHFAALVGGVLFAYAYFTRHLTDILPHEELAGSWIPWAILCLCRAIGSTRWLRWAALAALAYAAVPWLGGYIQLLLGLMAAGTVLLVALLRRPSRERWVRALASLLVFGILMGLVAAGKLLPSWHWSTLTDRAGGVTAEFALRGALQPAELLDWTLTEGWTPVALLLCGLVLGLRRPESWILPFAAAVAVLVLLASGVLYELLLEYVPGFNYLREPRRAWALMPAVLPVAAGLGLAHLQQGVRLQGRGRVLAAVLLLSLVVADRVVWSGYRVPRQHSLSSSLQANAIHQDLARRSREEPRFRVIDVTKARTRVKRTADLMRSSLGLESVEGVVGNVAIWAYDVDYLSIARESRAKLLGAMNCRYVTAERPVDEPGLVREGRFPPDPGRWFKGIDGPLLYRNELALPRAGLADHALLEVGLTPQQRKSLLLGRWDPKRILLVSAAPARVATLPDPDLRRFDGAVLGDDVDEALRERLRAAGVSCVDLSVANDQGVLDDWLDGRMAAATPIRTLDDPPRDWNSQRVSLPDNAGGRWLVLAETFAIYPGWSAQVDGVAANLFIANGVTTAIPLPSGARQVTLSYVPPGLVTGLGLTLAGLLLAGVAIRWRGRGGEAS